MKKEEKAKVYEIGYLLVSSIPKEDIVSIANTLRETLIKSGAEIISEEAPELRTLAYTMIKKIGSANYRFDEGYFGWFKFELGAEEIGAVKKLYEENPHMLRTLIITTIRENTYLGKKSPVPMPEITIEPRVESASESMTESKVASVASIEEIDKSIDAMVK